VCGFGDYMAGVACWVGLLGWCVRVESHMKMLDNLLIFCMAVTSTRRE